MERTCASSVASNGSNSKSTGQTLNAKKSNEMNKNSEQLSSRSRRRPWAEPGERSVIINEYESDETSRTKQFSQLQTWRNHSLKATRKKVDEKM